MSTVASPRWIIVDDTDNSIQYSGPWFADFSGSQDQVGNWGPAYKSTLHGTTLNASLAYNFNGTQVRVYGNNNLRNDSGVLDPTLDCFVDDINIGISIRSAVLENHWVFCEQNTLVDGPHVLTVNVTVMKSQTFWFDEIQYVPSATVPLDNKTILIDNVDPELQPAYGSGWVPVGDGGIRNMTRQTNSTFTFNFTGVSLSWYGLIATITHHAATTATYSVDGETPVNFLLQGLPTNSTPVYNQKFFETDQLVQGNHQIIVLYQGNDQTTPLNLDYLLIQNGTTPQNTTSSSTPSSSASSSSTPSSSVSSKSVNQHSSNIGGIAVGIIAFIILAFLIYLYIRRRENWISLYWRGNNSSRLTPQPFICWNIPMETSGPDSYTSTKTNLNTQSLVTAINGGRRPPLPYTASKRRVPLS